MHNEICEHLSNLGYECITSSVFGFETVLIKATIEGLDLQLMLMTAPPYYRLPEFVLLMPESYGRLAHVSVQECSGVSYGVICVNAPDSLSINFEQPLLVIQESLKRHLALLEQCLTQPEWNQRELLREFYSEWLRNCVQGNSKPLLANIEKPVLQSLVVYKPIKGREYGLESHYMTHPADSSFSGVSDIHLSLVKGNRDIAGKAVVIPIQHLAPAPTRVDSIDQWYLDTISSLPADVLNDLRTKFGQWRELFYWVIFTAKIANKERTWFGLKLIGKSKKPLPLSPEAIKNWKLEAIPIRLFNQENTVRRGGGDLFLTTKKVAVIGVGSVGCEIAHKLSAAGIRDLTLVDPDVYEINNLYRHLLDQQWLDAPKSAALSIVLQRQFPWSNAKWQQNKLSDFTKRERLNLYDLIVVAIGNPTQERWFKQYLLDNKVNVAVLNTWLEGFGVGGHAVLDVPSSRGCLLCSYVCQESGNRGLVSNLNFIEPNQITMKSMAGCGEQFISYGAVTSAQTGVMAANLAIRFLEGKQTESCKVSWSGEADDALAEGVRLTHRYYNFRHSLQYLPLVNEDCDVCSHQD